MNTQLKDRLLSALFQLLLLSIPFVTLVYTVTESNGYFDTVDSIVCLVCLSILGGYLVYQISSFINKKAGSKQPPAL